MAASRSSRLCRRRAARAGFEQTRSAWPSPTSRWTLAASARVPAAGGQGRVRADHETLARVQRRADLGEAAVVEQGHLHAVLGGQLADGVVAQGGDPAQAGVLPQVLDLGVGQHAAVADQDEPPQSEAAAQGFNAIGHGGGVGGVARVGLHGDRAAATVGQHAVDDDRAAALAVAAVAALHEGAGAAFVVAGRDVVEHLGVLVEVALGEAFLDAVLALEQPVHGVVEVVLVGIEEGEFAGEGAGVPEAGGSRRWASMARTQSRWREGRRSSKAGRRSRWKASGTSSTWP